MNQRLIIFAVAIPALFCGASLYAAEDASFKDLKATIALQGMTCDQVVNVKRNGDSDYNATCKDGNRYHVFVSAQGRVMVQKQ